MFGIDGAAGLNNLEPESTACILAELEEWGRYLSSDPEIIHKLRAFDAASGFGGNGGDTKPKPRSKQSTGPSL